MEFSLRKNGEVMTNIRVEFCVGLQEIHDALWVYDRFESLDDLTRSKVMRIVRRAFWFHGIGVEDLAVEIDEGEFNLGRSNPITSDDLLARIEELFPELTGGN